MHFSTVMLKGSHSPLLLMVTYSTKQGQENKQKYGRGEKLLKTDKLKDAGPLSKNACKQSLLISH